MPRASHTILFGNGLNRLSPGCPSWSDLLKGVAGDARSGGLQRPQPTAEGNSFDGDLGKIPYTFQYEIRLPESYYTPLEFEGGGYGGRYGNTCEMMERSERIMKERLNSFKIGKQTQRINHSQ